MRDRAYRRAQRDRMRQRVIRMVRTWNALFSEDLTNPRFVGHLMADRTPCSCYMCGNPRRHFGELTMQELRANQALRGIAMIGERLDGL